MKSQVRSQNSQVKSQKSLQSQKSSARTAISQIPTAAEYNSEKQSQKSSARTAISQIPTAAEYNSEKQSQKSTARTAISHVPGAADYYSDRNSDNGNDNGSAVAEKLSSGGSIGSYDSDGGKSVKLSEKVLSHESLGSLRSRTDSQLRPRSELVVRITEQLGKC